MIPFIAAIATVIWGLGYCGWRGITFDPLILVIPMIITARAVSHTVQMAERFFEDYETACCRATATRERRQARGRGDRDGRADRARHARHHRRRGRPARDLVTTIPQMRDLGEFGAFWVTSILFTVEILHPIMICYLPAPHDPQHFLPELHDPLHARGRDASARIPTWKYVVGVRLDRVCSPSPPTSRSSTRRSARRSPARRCSGPTTSSTSSTADDRQEVRRRGRVPGLRRRRQEGRQRRRRADPPHGGVRALHGVPTRHLGATVSVVPFLKAYWGQNHFGDPKWSFIPDDSGSVRSALFQLRQNGAPGFLRPFMTDDGRYANLSFIYRDHKGDTICASGPGRRALRQAEPDRRGDRPPRQEPGAEDDGWLQQGEVDRHLVLHARARCCPRAATR